MSLPIDLVLVRHGQSEGNLAKRRSEAGDHGAYTAEFKERHTSSYRLSQKGREQAAAAGDWIRNNLCSKDLHFDRWCVSEYARAWETAALLQLPGAKWYTDAYLSERDWGNIESLPIDEREEKFGQVLRQRDIQPFFWAPPNGESFMTLCLRVDRVLNTLHRECGDKRVVVVCHGEVMWAFRLRLERMTQARFRELHLSTESKDRIHNCQILHYSRRNPETNRLAPHLNWLRMIRPTDPKPVLLDWEGIQRASYTNEELLERVNDIPVLVH